MANPLHSPDYLVFRELLVKAREDSGLTQVSVAEQLSKPQSFVSKYERGERRLDFTEFMDVALVLGIDIPQFVDTYRKGTDQRFRNRQP